MVSKRGSAMRFAIPSPLCYNYLMSVVTLDFSLDKFPDLHVRDGQSVRGCIRDGKLHVTIPVLDDSDVGPSAAQAFVSKWSGKGRLLTADEMADDPRLAELTAKHVH